MRCFLWGLFSFFFWGFCQPLPADDFAIRCIREQPVLDGDLSDTVWQRLSWREGFMIPGSEQLATAATRFKVYHNNHELYIGIECEEPEMAKIVDTPIYSSGSSHIWMHDSIEVNILPQENLLNLYKFIINSRGVTCALWGEDDNTDRANYAFNQPYANHLRCEVKRYADKWVLEMALPFGAMNFPPEVNSQWRFNIGRNRYTVKPAELSASSRLSKPKNHMQIRDFQKVELQGFVPSPYQWEFANFETGTQRQESGMLQCRFGLDVINRSGEFRICRGRVSVLNQASETIGRDEWEFDLSDAAFSRQQRLFDLSQQGEFWLDFELISSQGYLLKKMRQLVELRYQPLQVKVLRPAYRNNIYATMPDKTIELELQLKEFIGIPLVITAEGEGIQEKLAIAVSQAKNQIIFKTDAWPNGRYQISIVGQTDTQQLRQVIHIRKLPYQRGEVWLDGEGVVHYDGKPRLPIGWYLNSPHNLLYDTAVNRTHFRDFDSFRNVVANQEEAGRIIIYNPYQEFHPVKYNNWRWEIFRDPEDRRGGVTAAQKQKMKEFLPEASKLAGIMGWYLADEPEGRDHNPGWYVEMVELMQELDPYHPTFMLNWGIDGMRKFYSGCDILMPDCYPQFFHDGSTGKPLWCSSEWMQALKQFGRPGWLMIQISPWPDFSADRQRKGVPPSFDDIRSQFYQALIHDAKGITMYAYFDASRFESARLGSDAVLREIRILEPLLRRNSIPGAIQYQSKPDERFFQVAMKKNDGLTAIIAVNTCRETRKLRFQLAEDIGTKLYVAGENRKVTLQGKVFTDEFAPAETHVYLNDAALAARVPAPEAARQEIQAAIAARKKPGNRIGTGELFAGDYQDFGNGKFSQDMVRLSASTETTTYPTKNTGTLYYLLDGLTDPTQPYYSWQPKKDDGVPWLDITLPEEMEVKEMKLYSGYDAGDRRPLLQAASILLLQEDGSYSVLASNDQLQDLSMSLSFTPIKTKQLRIRIDRWQPELKGYLLTEVELY
ncbi:MAG: sugar-binding protein [Lentisphaeria bacterium]